MKKFWAWFEKNIKWFLPTVFGVLMIIVVIIAEVDANKPTTTTDEGTQDTVVVDSIPETHYYNR